MPLIIPIPDHFPQELVDKIIDEISGIETRPTLEACSMVCRSWRPRAAYHLFRFKRFLLNLIRSHTNARIQSSPLYIAFSNPPSYPASFITNITISGISRISMLKLALGCLHLYPNLRGLSLFDIDFFKFSLPKIKALSQVSGAVPGVRQLRVTNIYFTSMVQLATFACYFLNLSVINLSRVGFDRSRLQRRKQGSFDTAELIAKRSPTSSSPSFTELLGGISDDYQGTNDPYADVLNIIGKSTTHLLLRGSAVSHFTPELCPSLTHLSMEVDFRLTRSKQLETLASTPSSVAVIYLHMLGGFLGVVRFVDLLRSPDKKQETIATLDQLLAPVSRMPSLEKLILGSSLFKNLQLPETNKRGCVRIIPESDSRERDIFEC